MQISIRPAVTQSGNDKAMSVTFTLWGEESDELRQMIVTHLPHWAELFQRKNSEYGGGAAFDLGERGQFSDMYRKMIKLKRAMWDENESVLTTEGVDEILMDLIGHAFLTLVMRDRKHPSGPQTSHGISKALGMKQSGEPVGKEDQDLVREDDGLDTVWSEPSKSMDAAVAYARAVAAEL